MENYDTTEYNNSWLVHVWIVRIWNIISLKITDISDKNKNKKMTDI